MPIYNGGGGVAGITVEQDPTALKMASNLSDLVNKVTARSNLQVLSSTEVSTALGYYLPLTGGTISVNGGINFSTNSYNSILNGSGFIVQDIGQTGDQTSITYNQIVLSNSGSGITITPQSITFPDNTSISTAPTGGGGGGSWNGGTVTNNITVEDQYNSVVIGAQGYVSVNSDGHSTVTIGSGQVYGVESIVFSDNTSMSTAPSGGGGGSGISDAPSDGITYARKNGSWVSTPKYTFTYSGQTIYDNDVPRNGVITQPHGYTNNQIYVDGSGWNVGDYVIIAGSDITINGYSGQYVNNNSSHTINQPSSHTLVYIGTEYGTHYWVIG